MTEAAPAWAETSIRWLRSKYPEYVSSRSSRAFVEQLSAALFKMGMFRDDTVSAPGSSYRHKIKTLEMALKWTAEDHNDMVKFLTVKEKVREVEAAVELSDWHETDDSTVKTAIESFVDATKKSQRKKTLAKTSSAVESEDDEKELEEAVSAAIAQQDPRFGSW